jgi:hypothetical protein
MTNLLLSFQISFKLQRPERGEILTPKQSVLSEGAGHTLAVDAELGAC